jgi:hypothetical protein
MAFTTAEIVDALRASRDEFGRSFLQAQIEVVENPAERIAFKVAALGGDRDPFSAALDYARQQNFLDALVLILADKGLETGGLTKLLARETLAAPKDDAQRAKLQAITNMAQGFQRPEVMFRGLNLGMRWTVKILIGGDFQGSGVLIGPHLVLTNWHVVRPLFTPSGVTGRYDPKKGAQNLGVEFDDLSGLLNSSGTLAGPERVSAHADWYVAHSECHPAELEDKLPDNPEDLKSFEDFALIRLSRSPGWERRWAVLEEYAEVPALNGRIIVFQYPKGQPMRLDDNVIASDDQIAAAYLQYRFLHRANTLDGSSGSPCFDRTFVLFGLHQGVWPKASGKSINRGIRILRFKGDLQKAIREVPTPDPPLCRLPDDSPVVGCDPFQTLVWKSVLEASPRLIVIVSGAAKAGKTFRLAVLAAMLPDTRHLKIELQGDAISKMDPLQLAGAICRAAGAKRPDFVAAADFNNTLSNWISDEIVTKTIAALDDVRNGRLVWISIKDLNNTDILGDASPFLLDLYDRVRTADWLRIVLDGMKSDLPAAIRKLTETHRVTEVTSTDIERYLGRAISEVDTPNQTEVRRMAGAAFKQYQRGLNSMTGSAIKDLAVRLRDDLDAYFGVS